ncbi:hypothetical protein PG5_01550 [Pseudomonas sp. G5(2012)]|nr:hypothetical protein PG5_01550 [Pseudomonas sp. G5(2012)]
MNFFARVMNFPGSEIRLDGARRQAGRASANEAGILAQPLLNTINKGN